MKNITNEERARCNTVSLFFSANFLTKGLAPFVFVSIRWTWLSDQTKAQVCMSSSNAWGQRIVFNTIDTEESYLRFKRFFSTINCKKRHLN